MSDDSTGMSAPVDAHRSWRWPLPPFALIVPLAAGLGGAASLAWKPGVARSMLASPRALGFSLAVAALILGLGWLLPRLGRGALVTVAAQLVPALLVFGVTVLPAFRDVTLGAPLPLAAPPATAGSTPGTEALSDTKPAGEATAVGRAPLHGIDHRQRRGPAGAVGRLAHRATRFARRRARPRLPGASSARCRARETRRRGAPGPAPRKQGQLELDVPPGALTAQPLTVLIWCRAFAVPVAAATIS